MRTSLKLLLFGANGSKAETMSITGASLIYSLRRNAGYTGPLFAGFTTSNATVVDCFAVQEAKNFAGSGDFFLTKFYDQSGSGNHSTGYTVITSSKNDIRLVKNGQVITTRFGKQRPAVEFGEYPYGPGLGGVISTPAINLVQLFYVSEVYPYDGTWSSRQPWVLGHTTLNDFWTTAGAWFGAISSSFIRSGSIRVNGSVLVSYGVLRAPDVVNVLNLETAGGSVAFNQMSQDRTDPIEGAMNCRLTEMVCFPSALSAGTRTSIETEMINFYT